MYALIALGYTLIFGVMRLIFFAQGEICMMGAFGALGAVSLIAGHHLQSMTATLVIALMGAVLIALAAGLLAERLAMRPLRQAPRTKQLIASLGVSMVLQNIVLLWVSSENVPFPKLFPETSLSLGAVVVSPIQIFIWVGSLVLMLALEWILRQTRVGLRLRAVAESVETAELDGIRVDRTMMMTFAIGSVLAGFAGVMLASYDGVAKYNMGFLPGIKGFTAAILGGFGNPGGAMLGGLILGLAESMAAGYISSTYKDLLTFALLVLILVVRPLGLTGKGVIAK
jgi:branched-chain amino acid transport system permease protein